MLKALLFIAAINVQPGFAQDPQPAVQPGDMKEFTLNGFNLSGSEFWVFQAGKEFKYPDDVIWSFTGAPDSAETCAIQAYNKLIAFLTHPPVEFIELGTLKGATPNFYLWTNDYTQAAPEEEERPAKFWHWNRGDKDYTKGYWKWESSVAHDGTCTVPRDEQINDMIREIREKLGL